jgi:hypothetical protein
VSVADLGCLGGPSSWQGSGRPQAATSDGKLKNDKSVPDGDGDGERYYPVTFTVNAQATALMTADAPCCAAARTVKNANPISTSFLSPARRVERQLTCHSKLSLNSNRESPLCRVEAVSEVKD